MDYLLVYIYTTFVTFCNLYCCYELWLDTVFTFEHLVRYFISV